MKIVCISILLYSLLTSFTLAQQYKCAECNKKIIREFITVDGKHYHIDHFKCSECRKKIEGNYTKSEGKYYHPQCYFNEVLPKCDVCNKPLEGEFYKDIYGKKYHRHHLNDYIHCDNCNRLTAERITNGGRKFNDGRYLCNICNRTAIKSENQYRRILNSVKNRLKNIGIWISNAPVSIFPVDQKRLNQVSNRTGIDRLRGFCHIESQRIVLNGKSTVNDKYSIYVLNNLPSIYTESTIAHELMHIWLYENTHNKHSEALEEGSCHFISYLYLKTTRSKEAQWIIELMKNDQNKIYGGGFRKVLKIFDGKPVSQLLTFLKENKKL